MNTLWYIQQIQRKRPWTPTCGEPGELRQPGTEETLSRILALRCLELDVAAWITESSRRYSIHPEVLEVLYSNIQDEPKHDQVLSAAAQKMPWVNPEDERQALQIKEAWEAHPDAPVVKAFVLENSVFFVALPMLRLFGDAALRTISRDISGDETCHAAVHRQLAKDLGLTYSPSLNRLRRETVAWLVERLHFPGEKGSPRFWMEQSDSLLERGIAPGLQETRRAVMPAFFETPNTNLPRYA